MIAHAVAHKPPVFHIFWPGVYRREPVLYREVYNLFSVRIEDGALQHEDCVSTPLGCGSECSLNILGILVRLGIEAVTRTPLRRVPVSFNTCALPGSVEVPRTATRESLGTISFRSSSCFPLISGARVDNPVMFPPGRARLATKPVANRIAIMRHDNGNRRQLLPWRHGLTGGPAVTMTSTLRRTSSAASAGRRSSFPSAYRYSMTMFFPST